MSCPAARLCWEVWWRRSSSETPCRITDCGRCSWQRLLSVPWSLSIASSADSASWCSACCRILSRRRFMKGRQYFLRILYTRHTPKMSRNSSTPVIKVKAMSPSANGSATVRSGGPVDVCALVGWVCVSVSVPVCVSVCQCVSSFPSPKLPHLSFPPLSLSVCVCVCVCVCACTQSAWQKKRTTEIKIRKQQNT